MVYGIEILNVPVRTAQVAILLSFGFFALQMKTWPYKVNTDNLFRAATELHVFLVITTALVLKNDLTWEPVTTDAYDYVLFGSFLILVPGAFVVAIVSKLLHIRKVLAVERSTDNNLMQRQLAFDLQVLGLAEHSDRRAYVCFLSSTAGNIVLPKPQLSFCMWTPLTFSLFSSSIVAG